MNLQKVGLPFKSYEKPNTQRVSREPNLRHAFLSSKIGILSATEERKGDWLRRIAEENAMFFIATRHVPPEE